MDSYNDPNPPFLGVMLRECLGPGLDWDHLGDLAISGGKGPMDSHDERMSVGRSGGMTPGNVFNFESLKRYFPHSEGTFEQNIKVLNNIF